MADGNLRIGEGSRGFVEGSAGMGEGSLAVRAGRPRINEDGPGINDGSRGMADGSRPVTRNSLPVARHSQPRCATPGLPRVRVGLWAGTDGPRVAAHSRHRPYSGRHQRPSDCLPRSNDCLPPPGAARFRPDVPRPFEGPLPYAEPAIGLPSLPPSARPSRTRWR